MSDLIEREYLLNIARKEEAYGYVSEHEILNAPTAEPKVGEWISVKKRLPKVNKPVLISAKYNNYKYVCVGKWVEKYSVEDEGEEFDSADYNEENDTYYYPEGWYECIYNWGDYSDVFISDEVIAWQPLPKPYEMERRTDEADR